MTLMQHTRLGVLVCAILVGFSSVAEVPPEYEFLGKVESLPTPFSPYWIWTSDAVLNKMSLIDLLSGDKLGEVDGGLYITTGLFPGDDASFYIPETHYSLGSRGERLDVITFYDSVTLSISDEVFLPTQRAQNALPVANSAISDDGRFLAIYNFTPAQSISIVDTRSKAFVSEITTPGCGLTYAAGDRRFFLLCANGSLMLITLGERGELLGKTRSKPFFDPAADPITEKGVRFRDNWYFVSFDGYMYRVNVADDPRFDSPWSLLSDADREDDWKVGGRQFLAIDEKRKRAFVLLHRGDVDTHKTGGTHLGVYDLEKKVMIERLPLESPGFTFSGQSIEFGQDWIWPFNGLYNAIGRLAMRLEPHARPDALLVTGGDKPLLVIAGEFSGSVAVYDAESLEFLHRVSSSNWTTLAIQNPGWGR